MTEIFVGATVIQTARTPQDQTQQAIPTYNSSGWCAVLKKGI